MIAASHLQALSKKYHEKTETMQSRILELERSKAKSDAEVEILEREKATHQNKLNKLEAMLDALRVHQKVPPHYTHTHTNHFTNLYMHVYAYHRAM